MKAIKRVTAIVAVLVLLAAMLPMSVFATEATDPTSSTSSTSSTTSTNPTSSTTASQEKIKLSNLYIVGSNNKNYLADPSLSSGVNKYSFYLPDWMDSATLIIKSSLSLNISCENAEFEGNSGSYTGQLKLTGSKNTFTVKLKNGDDTRTLTINVYLSDIPCKLEKVSVIRGGEAVAATSGSTDKLECTLPAGTTTGISLRIVPRHEQTVSLTNLTGIPTDQITGNEQKTELKLHEAYKRYDHNLTLVEGTNVFLVTVTAGNVKKECTVTIIVGDPNANVTTTTQSTETTTIPTTPPTDFNVTTAPTTAMPNNAGSTGSPSAFPPVLWVTVGVVIAVVLGACVFMIVNMGNRGNGNGGGYDDYGYDDYGYDDYDQPRYPVRRNLGEYVDDGYDDYGYGGRPQPPRGGGYSRGGYNSNSYNNFTDGYNPDYRSGYGESSYDDGYGSGTPRSGSGGLGGFESDDDYGSGNYYGGY